LITENGEIIPWSRLYQPEASEPSGPGWVFFVLGTNNSFYFFPFLLSPHPFVSTVGLEGKVSSLRGRLKWMVGGQIFEDNF